MQIRLFCMASAWQLSEDDPQRSVRAQSQCEPNIQKFQTDQNASGENADGSRRNSNTIRARTYLAAVLVRTRRDWFICRFRGFGGQAGQSIMFSDSRTSTGSRNL